MEGGHISSAPLCSTAVIAGRDHSEQEVPSALEMETLKLYPPPGLICWKLFSCNYFAGAGIQQQDGQMLRCHISTTVVLILHRYCVIAEGYMIWAFQQEILCFTEN